MRQHCVLILTLLSVCAVAQAAPPHERTVLPNGLVIIAIQDSSSAIAAFHLAVRVSPDSVPANRAGVLALSQQVAQLRLREVLQQEAWRALSEDLDNTRAILTLNTEMDFAEVRCQVAAQTLPGALQAAGQALFDRTDCMPEQVAAAKDILSNALADGAENVVESTYYRFLYAFHGSASPLARPVEGTPESLLALSAVDVNAFRSTFLGPNNASLCVMGPQSPSELTHLVTEAMHGYARATTTSPQAIAPPLPTESVISVATMPKWQGASVMVGVGIPPYGTAGYLHAQLIYTLLDGAKGRLRQDPAFKNNLGLNQIMGRQSAPPSVTVLAPMAMPRPFLVMHMMTIPQLMEPAREAMLGNFLAFATRAPGADELAAGKRRLINAYATMLLSRLNFAKSINCYEVYGQDYNRLWTAPQDIEAITGEDLVKTAKACFGTHAIGLIMPGDDEEQ